MKVHVRTETKSLVVITDLLKLILYKEIAARLINILNCYSPFIVSWDYVLNFLCKSIFSDQSLVERLVKDGKPAPFPFNGDYRDDLISNLFHQVSVL